MSLQTQNIIPISGLDYPIIDKVETHLLARNTIWDISKPFPIKDVTNVMETLLHCCRFDAKWLKSRYSKKEYIDTDFESDLDDSDTDYDSDDESDSGFETYTLSESPSESLRNT